RDPQVPCCLDKIWSKFRRTLRTGDLRLGNSEGLDSRTFTALHSEPKSSISLEAVAQPDPTNLPYRTAETRISGSNWGSKMFFSLSLRPRDSSGCAPRPFTRSAPVDTCPTSAS